MFLAWTMRFAPTALGRPRGDQAGESREQTVRQRLKNFIDHPIGTPAAGSGS